MSLLWSVSELLATSAVAVVPNRPLGIVVTLIAGAAPPAAILVLRVQVPSSSQIQPLPVADPNAPPRFTVVVPVAGEVPRLRTVAL